MDNFQRRTRGNKRQAIDGVFNAPVRSGPQQAPQGQVPRFEGLRPSGRKLDDFRRPEGLHSSQGGVRRGPQTAELPQRRSGRYWKPRRLGVP